MWMAGDHDGILQRVIDDVQIFRSHHLIEIPSNLNYSNELLVKCPRKSLTEVSQKSFAAHDQRLI